jgi:hypothetical protein
VEQGSHREEEPHQGDDDDRAPDEGQHAALRVAAGQDALGDVLIRSVGREGEGEAAHEARDERSLVPEAPREVEHLHLSGKERVLEDRGEASDVRDERGRGDGGSGHERDAEEDVRPDHRPDPACQGVDRTHGAHDEDGVFERELRGRREREAAREEPDAAPEDPPHEEERCRDDPGSIPEAPLEIAVDGDDLVAMEGGDEEEGEEEAPARETEDHLEERPVSRVGFGGRADVRDGARLRGDDGEGRGPPGNGLSPEEVIPGGALPRGHPERDPEDDREVDPDHDPVPGAHGQGV